MSDCQCFQNDRSSSEAEGVVEIKREVDFRLHSDQPRNEPNALRSYGGARGRTQNMAPTPNCFQYAFQEVLKHKK
jgi:hypothetical protein